MGSKRKRYTPEQIITKLREFETHRARGMSAVEAIREIGVSEPTFYRWRKQYGLFRVNYFCRFASIILAG